MKITHTQTGVTKIIICMQYKGGNTIHTVHACSKLHFNSMSCVQKREFSFFKKNIKSFIYINIVAFKIVPI